MSSILKALKKVERETSNQDGLKTWPKEVDAKDVINKHAKRRWLFNRFSSVLFGAAIIAILGWAFLNQKPLLLDKLFHDDVSLKKEKEEKKTPSLTAQKITERILISDREIKTETAKNIDFNGNESVRSKPLTGEMPLLRNVKEHENPINQEQRSLEEKQPITSRLLEESRLKLQAIAWSSNPDERIAVINNCIIREGESIEGFLVTRIGNEAVIVREGGEEKELIFKLK